MQYCLIKEDNMTDLERIVNEHLKVGWKPQGGISVFYHQGARSTYYVQAMVKE